MAMVSAAYACGYVAASTATARCIPQRAPSSSRSVLVRAVADEPAPPTAPAPAPAPPTGPVLSSSTPAAPLSKKKKYALMAEKKQQVLSLRFIWMEKNIGIGLDQVIPEHGTIPLSPFYFWPKKDAWEELRASLESKPWISRRRTIILLNQATDIINLWQQKATL